MEVLVNTDKLKFHKRYRLKASRDKLFFSFSFWIPTRHPPTSEHGTFEHHQRNIIHHHYHRVWAKRLLRKETLVMFPPYVSYKPVRFSFMCSVSGAIKPTGVHLSTDQIPSKFKAWLGYRYVTIVLSGESSNLAVDISRGKSPHQACRSPPHWLYIWL